VNDQPKGTDGGNDVPQEHLRRAWLRSVSVQYLVWIVPVIFLLLGGFGGVMYWVERESELQQHHESARIIAEKTNQALRQWIEMQIRLATLIAADPRILALCRAPRAPETRQAAQAYLSEVHRLFPYCENIPVALHLPTGEPLELVLADGVRRVGNGNFLIDTVGGRTIGRCNPDFSYIKETFGGRDYFISEVYPSILQGAPIFVVAAPVRGADGVLGAVIVAPRMDHFTELFLDKSRLGETGYLLMVDERGMIISHPRKELILDKKAAQFMAPHMAHIREGRMMFRETFEGESRFYTVTPFSAADFNILHNWYILSSRACAEVIGEASDKLRWMIYCIGLVGLLAAVTILGVTTRVVRRPLMMLIRAADRVASGDLQEVMVPVTRRDEIGLLNRAIRHMTESLRNQTRLVGTSAGVLDQSVQRIQETSRAQESLVHENKATTAEVAASAHEISATSQSLAAAMRNLSDTASATEAGADAGHISLESLQATMQRLLRASGEISGRLEDISERAGSIGAVITVITKVADQTNLLSLNASLEAEKAGQYGVGFAVVAREIRRLADQTAVATLDIERIIQEMQAAVQCGVSDMERFIEDVQGGARVAEEAHHRLYAIIDQVKTLAPRFEEVNAGMREQSQGAAEISQAIRQISDAAMQTTEGLALINRATTDLRQASTDLQGQVSHFRI